MKLIREVNPYRKGLLNNSVGFTRITWQRPPRYPHTASVWPCRQQPPRARPLTFDSVYFDAFVRVSGDTHTNPGGELEQKCHCSYCCFNSEVGMNRKRLFKLYKFCYWVRRTFLHPQPSLLFTCYKAGFHAPVFLEEYFTFWLGCAGSRFCFVLFNTRTLVYEIQSYRFYSSFYVLYGYLMANRLLA